MKDIAHHKEKFQRKILREARKAELTEEETREIEYEEESNPTSQGVEIEEIPTICRPLNRKFH